MTDLEKQELVSMLHVLVMEAVPIAQTETKYGGTLYTVNPEDRHGAFCGVFAYKNHVHLAFALGAQLHDPNGILLGNGNFRRHLNFTDADEIDPKIVKRFIKASSKLK